MRKLDYKCTILTQEYDAAKLAEIKGWCSQTFGIRYFVMHDLLDDDEVGAWDLYFMGDKYIFKFEREQDMIMFALKWS